MIPKIIHYVWVGDKPKSELVIKCIDSWKKFCPDYQIMEWGNEEVAKIKNLYVQQAFENKKWAFVSDYLRLYALNKFGGFYFDTDLEITNPIDEFRNLEFVSGYEDYNGTYSPITAFMGADSNCKIIHDLLHSYDNLLFIKGGEMDQTTNTVRITKYFEDNFDLHPPYSPNKITHLSEKYIIYPSYYFCVSQNNQNNYSIHHFNGSWIDTYKRTVMFNLGHFRLIRFKNRKNIESELPILINEKIIFLFKFLKYKIGLIQFT